MPIKWHKKGTKKQYPIGECIALQRRVARMFRLVPARILP